MLWSSCSNYIKVRKCAWTMVITHYELFFFTYNVAVSGYSIDIKSDEDKGSIFPFWKLVMGFFSATFSC